jgi:hypothetical protein
VRLGSPLLKQGALPPELAGVSALTVKNPFTFTFPAKPGEGFFNTTLTCPFSASDKIILGIHH